MTTTHVQGIGAEVDQGREWIGFEQEQIENVRVRGRQMLEQPWWPGTWTVEMTEEPLLSGLWTDHLVVVV
jgi:hypothetical protein